MTSQATTSIAVLPLVNRSPDPSDEYISDGITEELILALTKIEGLRVSALTSSFTFKNKVLDIRSIGQQLGVANILEGSVRKARNQVRVSLQLITVEDGFCLWSERYERELDDIFALQDEISLKVADHIRENFGHLQIADRLVERPTENLKAYEYYIRGRQQMRSWNGPGISEAIDLMKAATQEDPLFAKAYFELAWAYYLLISWRYLPADTYLPMAQAYARKAEDLAGHTAEYFYLKATESFWVNWDFPSTRMYLQKSLAIEPNNSQVLESMAELCLATGKFSEGLIFVERSLEIDPLSANHHYTKARYFDFLDRTEEALGFYQRAIELNPEFELAHGHKAQDYIRLNQLSEVEACLPHCENSQLINTLAEVYYLPEKATGIMQTIPEVKEVLFPWKLYIAAHSGDEEACLELFHTATKQRWGAVINYRFDPLLRHLGHSPNFSPWYQLEADKIPAPIERSAPEENHVDEEFIEKLEAYMVAEERFLEPKLSLRQLAEEMDCHANFLSYQINSVIGLNFKEYLNGYRLKRFQEIAVDPANKNLTLLALAFDSGFNTKSVFNEFFKKKTGLSPRAWLKGQAIK